LALAARPISWQMTATSANVAPAPPNCSGTSSPTHPASTSDDQSTARSLASRSPATDRNYGVATNKKVDVYLEFRNAEAQGMLRARAGRIILMSSVVGLLGSAGQANYAASKAGLIGFCKSLAREVASRQVTVNVVAPGLIETDMTRAITEDAKTDWSAQIPLGRMGSPAEVAAAVSFLASDEASYITGQVLAVNGGMYM